MNYNIYKFEIFYSIRIFWLFLEDVSRYISETIYNNIQKINRCLQVLCELISQNDMVRQYLHYLYIYIIYNIYNIYIVLHDFIL